MDRNDGSRALDDANFEIRSGEILGVAGIAGSGQKELCETVAGLMQPKAGAILYKKQNLAGKTPRQIIDMSSLYLVIEIIRLLQNRFQLLASAAEARADG